MRVEIAKCEPKWQNASQNGKTRVETACSKKTGDGPTDTPSYRDARTHLKIFGWTHLKDPLM